jgi:CBS domain-containing protein
MSGVQRTISEFLVDRNTPVVAPDDTVAHALSLMSKEKDFGVFVVEDGQLVGIFTEKDFATRVAALKLIPADVDMKSVMTPKPETLSPEDDVAYAINKMALGGFRHVPIVTNDGQIKGVINVRDVVSHLNEVFGAVETDNKEPVDEWVDIGGG